MLDFKSDFINKLIQIRTAQFSKDVSTDPTKVLDLTTTFQSEMKSLVGEQKIPRKYQLHFANLQLVKKFVFEEDEALSKEIELKKPTLKTDVKGIIDTFLQTKYDIKYALPTLIWGFKDDDFEYMAARFSAIVKLFLEQRKAVVDALKNDGDEPGPQTTSMSNLVSDENARMARVREMQRIAEEDRKRKQAQEEQQRQMQIAAQLEQAKKERLAAQKKEAQEKAQRDEAQRQQEQQRQAQAQSSSTSKADFAAKRQQILAMHQQQLAITPALGLSRQVDQQKLTVKKMVDDELAAIEARRYTSSYIVQQCDRDFENNVKANMPATVAEVQTLLAKKQRDIQDMQEHQRQMELQYQYQREQQAAYERAQAEERAKEQKYERRYNYA